MARDGETTIASERSPLLAKADGSQANGDIQEEVASLSGEISDGEANEPGETGIKEPTPKELFLIMGSLYLGVFFAALGTYSLSFPRRRMV